jgi:transposase
MDDSVRCPKCAKVVPLGKMVNEITGIDLNEQNVFLAVRRFQTTCPHCGPVLHDRVGHHGTIGEKDMARLFPKAHRKRIKNALPADERKLFDKTMAGKREPKDGEVERWLALQNANRAD